MKAKRTDPTIPITDKRFVPTRGADVQATWRKFGWVPPSATMTPPPPERVPDAQWEPMRRVK